MSFVGKRNDLAYLLCFPICLGITKLVSASFVILSLMACLFIPIIRYFVYSVPLWNTVSSVFSEIVDLFRQNTYLRNKKHTLTCQGGDWLLKS